MKFNILGSGGVNPPPRPGCYCRVCKEAKQKGIPFYRSGTSFYNYDSKTLFDLPEEIRLQLIKQDIFNIENVILTHWHPDHTHGLRVLEQLNLDSITHKAKNTPINIYISKFQLDMFKKMSCGNFLDFYENERKIIKVILLENNEILNLGNIKIIPRIILETKGFYYEIIENDKKLIYAPCEYYKLKVHEKTKNVDVFIAHHLWFEDKSIGKGCSWENEEDSFEKMLKDSKEMNAKKIIITHIEESFGLNHNELNSIVLEKYGEYNIEFSYDGMIIKI